MSKPFSVSRRVVAVFVAVVAAGSGVAGADTFEVTLEEVSFRYDGNENLDIDLVIEAGDTVRWLWGQGFHNVVSGFPEGGDEGELFESGPPTDVPGTVFEFTFLEPGVYGYHCHPHEPFGMVSFVTVLAPPGDVTGDGVVDVSDLVEVIVNWGPCPDPPAACAADLDTNGMVDVLDLITVISNWG